MERIRVRAATITFALILTVALGGCGGKNRLPDYRDVAFCARVAWETDGAFMEALVVSDLQGTQRIELLAPKELSGFVLLSEGRQKRILCGGVEMKGESMSALFETVGVILPAGERRVICRTEWEGESVMYAQVEGDPAVELYLDPESGVPIGIVRGDLTVRVRSFEERSEGREAP